MSFNQGELILYQTDDGHTELDVQLIDETVWLTQAQMGELFARNKRTVSEHIRNIFREGELQEESVVWKFRITAADGKTYQVSHYNLDVIISVGYRVKSKRGTQFRIWATTLLKQHLVQGYTLNQQRLAEKGVTEIRQVLDLLSSTLENHELVNDDGRFVLTLASKNGQTNANNSDPPRRRKYPPHPRNREKPPSPGSFHRSGCIPLREQQSRTSPQGR